MPVKQHRELLTGVDVDGESVQLHRQSLARTKSAPDKVSSRIATDRPEHTVSNPELQKLDPDELNARFKQWLSGGTKLHSSHTGVFSNKDKTPQVKSKLGRQRGASQYSQHTTKTAPCDMGPDRKKDRSQTPDPVSQSVDLARTSKSINMEAETPRTHKKVDFVDFDTNNPKEYGSTQEHATTHLCLPEHSRSPKIPAQSRTLSSKSSHSTPKVMSLSTSKLGSPKKANFFPDSPHSESSDNGQDDNSKEIPSFNTSCMSAGEVSDGDLISKSIRQLKSVKKKSLKDCKRDKSPLDLLMCSKTSAEQFVQACSRWPQGKLRELFRNFHVEYKRSLYRLYAVDAFQERGNFTDIIAGIQGSIKSKIHCERAAVLVYLNGGKLIAEPTNTKGAVSVEGTVFHKVIKSRFAVHRSVPQDNNEKEARFLGAHSRCILLMPMLSMKDNQTVHGLLCGINAKASDKFRPADAKALHSMADCLSGLLFSYHQQRAASNLRIKVLEMWENSRFILLCQTYFHKWQSWRILQRKKHQARECFKLMITSTEKGVMGYYFEKLTQYRILKKGDTVKDALMGVASNLASQMHQSKALIASVMAACREMCKSDRATLFMVDHKRGQIWSRIAEGIPEIRIPVGVGIAGTVAKTGDSINIPDAYADSRFNPAFDKKTGYKTNHILCVPLKNQKGGVVGVVQMINKLPEVGGCFTPTDLSTVMKFAEQAAVTLENAMRFQDMHDSKRMMECTMSALPHFFLSLDKNGVIHFSSQSAQSLLGIEIKDLTDVNYKEWWSHNHNKSFVTDITNTFENKVSVTRVEYELYIGENNTSTCTYTMAPVWADEDTSKELMGLSICIQWITPQTKRMDVLGRYIPPAVCAEIKHKVDANMRGWQQSTTCLYVDILDYSHLVEDLKPYEKIDVLNIFYEKATHIIESHGGVVMRHNMDGLFACFGLPKPGNGDAEKACKAALDLLEATPLVIHERKITWSIGLHSGKVITGLVGPPKRQEYTAIGTTSKLAIVVEGWARMFGLANLCTQFTKDLVTGIVFREVDQVKYKGEVYSLYEALGVVENTNEGGADGEQTQEPKPNGDRRKVKGVAAKRSQDISLRWYAQGLDLYRKGQWQAALGKFQAALESGDSAAKILMGRCQAYSKNAPQGEWDGISEIHDFSA